MTSKAGRLATRVLDGLAARRDRLLASPRFQRWAARFPLTRPVARRQASRLFDLCAGFVYSQVLLASVRTGLLDLLASGPLGADEVGRALSLPPDSSRRLLGAAGSLGLVEPRRGGRFGLGPLGAALLGQPGVRAMIEHHPLLYRDLEDPVALLRAGGGGGELAGFWSYARAEEPGALAEERVEGYSRLMAASQALVADWILDAYPMGGHRRLLDVGGGDGRFATRALERCPGLEARVFDLPPVAERARKRFAAEGLEDRAAAVGGNFLRDPLPTGADLVSLVRIVHDHDDADALALLRAVRRSLDEDGTLLLAEPLAGAVGARRVGDAYFAFYLLAMGSGRARSAAELRGLLARAGFDRIRELPTPVPLQTGILVARPAPGSEAAEGGPPG